METTISTSNSMETSATIVDKMETTNSKETEATNMSSSSKCKERRGFAVGRDKPITRKRARYRECTTLAFQPSQIHQDLISRKFPEKVDFSAAIYLSAVLQYITAEMVELCGQAAMKKDMDIISTRHVEKALMTDEEFSKFITFIAEDAKAREFNRKLDHFFSSYMSLE